MHADFKELLSLRDGEPIDASTEQHIVTCAQCRLELARLHGLKNGLRQMPQLSPPPLAWALIREELGRLPLRRQNWSWLTVYAASVLGAVIALAFLWSIHLGHGHAAVDSVGVASIANHNDALDPLLTRSQELEQILQGLPQRPTVQRAATSVAIDELQTRIQVVDLQLAEEAKGQPDRAQLNRLWNARVQLLNSLVYLRYAEAVRDGNASVDLPFRGVI